MRHLHLLRHAKSDRHPGVEDHERPLARRGRKESSLVGASLPAALGRLDLVLCSTALRTRETAALALANFAPPPPILFEDGLYLAGRAALLARLRQLDNRIEGVLVIGHNPGLADLALALADPDSPHYKLLASGKFPTAVRVSFAIDGAWADLARSRHRLTHYVTAKSLGKEG